MKNSPVLEVINSGIDYFSDNTCKGIKVTRTFFFNMHGFKVKNPDLTVNKFFEDSGKSFHLSVFYFIILVPLTNILSVNQTCS